MVADSAEADFEIAGDGVLAFAFFEHGENFAAQFGGMAGERFEGQRKFGRWGTLGHRDTGKFSRKEDARKTGQGRSNGDAEGGIP